MKPEHVTKRQNDKVRPLQVETWNALEIVLTCEERATNVLERVYFKLRNMIRVSDE
jgi:hypothetical protein